MDNTNKLDDILGKYKIPLAMGLVGLVLLLGGVFSSGILTKTFIKSTQVPITGGGSLVPTSIKVDVSGEVTKPGVYSVSSSARVEDAIKVAGGVTESADPNYLAKNLNLAQKVSDGMKIYVPKIQEAGRSGTPVVIGASTSLININEASLAELDTLPGVGTVTAQKIIDLRPYGSLEELVSKKAVTRSVYEKINGLVSTY